VGSLRVTQGILVDRVLRNINQQSRELLDLQDQLATGLRIQRPSDDPLAVRRAVGSQIELGKNEQYLNNISSIGPQLVESEDAILTVVDVLQRVNELTLQANNTVNGQEQLDQIANEVDQLLEQLVVSGNTVTNDRFVFGGTRTQTPPMEVTRGPGGEITAVNYAGNSDVFETEISEGITTPANVPGDRLFFSTSPQTVDIYQTVIDIRDAMQAGNFAGLDTGLANLEVAQEQLLVEVSRIGALQLRLERTDDSLRSINVQLRENISDNIDADFAEVTLNIAAESNAFEAALNAGARVIQPSLLSFLQ